MNQSLQFTRYLYEKEEVNLSLMVGLLNKKEYASFWAFELFYSGYTSDLINLLWNMYYDFYATLNPSFEKYLFNKLKAKNMDAKMVYSIINNFMIRPHTTDVFMLRHVTNFGFANNCDNYDKLQSFLTNEDYLQMAHFILNTDDKDLLKLFTFIINYFEKVGLKLVLSKEISSYNQIIKHDIHNKQIVLLSRVINYYTIFKKVKQGNKIFIHTNPNEIIMYETIEADLNKQGSHSKTPYLSILPAYKILQLACIYSIDEEDYLSLFHLKREKYNITNSYRENWEYYASFSPLWQERILKYNGKIDHNNKQIIFDTDDNQELFYEHYGLEPDEQSLQTQDKLLKPIKQVMTWDLFYKKHKNRGIVHIEDNYLSCLKKIDYMFL